MSDYVVAMFTHGSFHGWASDPLTEEEAAEFVADPPGTWKPRPQDELRIFELIEVQL